MRWFRQDRADDESVTDEDRARVASEYRDHLKAIASTLPAEVARLARDERLSLHDARFRWVVIDLNRRRVEMALEAGDLQLGYRLITLTFEDAAIVPDNLRALEYAVTAAFHLREPPSVTEVLDQEVDVEDGGSYVLRLRLDPFHEFAVVFAGLSIAEQPLDDRPDAQPGTVSILPRDATS